jgi:hypothetical protein
VIPEKYDDLCLELGFSKSFDCDSMLLFAALAKHKDINILQRIDGAMGVAFMLPNKAPDTVFVYRRSKTRDLHIGEANDGIYYSSEADPLHLIGCNVVYPVKDDHLYTLQYGKILDMYRMPDPIVKSLAPGVGRSGWRNQVPYAEINALKLKGAGSQGTNYVSTHVKNGGATAKTGTNRQLALSEALESRPKKALDNRIDYLHTYNAAKNEANGDKVLAKWYFIVRSIQEEIKQAGADVINNIINNFKTSIHDTDCCLLNIKLIDEKGMALGAWSICHKDDADLSTLTSWNGIGLIKVPVSLCGTSLELYVYDPIDQFKPQQITVTPERGRVMEVTLALPFRESGKKAGRFASLFSDLKPTDKSNIAGSEDSPAYNAYLNGSHVDATGGGRVNGVLSGESIPLSGGSEKGSGDENQDKEWDSSIIIPETETIPRSEIDIIRHKLLPNLETIHQKNMVEFLTRKSNHIGVNKEKQYYLNHMASHTMWLQLRHTEEYEFWTALYSKWREELMVNTMLQDAARLQAYDRVEHKVWYKLPFYITTLLKNKLYDYSYDVVAANGYVDEEKFFPEAMLVVHRQEIDELHQKYVDKEKKSSLKQSQRDTRSRNIAYIAYSEFLQWDATGKFSKRMADKEMAKNIRRHIDLYSDQLESNIQDANDTLQENENKSTAVHTEMRACIIRMRNFLVNEKEDVDAFLGQIDHQLSNRCN